MSIVGLGKPAIGAVAVVVSVNERIEWIDHGGHCWKDVGSCVKIVLSELNAENASGVRKILATGAIEEGWWLRN